MTIAVECAECKKRYSVDEKVSGKKVKCKHCGNVFLATPLAATTGASAPPKAAAPKSAAPTYAGSRSGSAPAISPRKTVQPATQDIGFRDDPPDFDALASLAGEAEAPFGAPVAMAPPPMPKHAAQPAPAYGAPAYAAPVYAAPAYAAPVQPYNPAAVYAANKRRSRSSEPDGVGIGTVLGGFGICIALSVVLVIAGLVMPSFARPGFFISLGLCWLLIIIGGLGLLITAFRDSVLQGFLCLFVPFYSLIYLITHWSECKGAFFISLAGHIFIVPAVVLVTSAELADTDDTQSAEVSEDDQSRSASNRNSSNSNSSSSNNTSSGSTEAPADHDANRADGLRARLRTLVEHRMDGRSREEVVRDLAELKNEANSNKARYESKPAWPEITALIQQVETRVPQLKSENPDPSIYLDPPLGVTWKNDANQDALLAPEVSYKSYKLRPLLETLVDLTTSEADPAGLAFVNSKQRSQSLRIRTFPRADVRQKRPWVASQDFETRSPKKGNLFVLNAVGLNPTVSFGRINGMNFTRVESDGSGSFSSRWVKLYTIDGNDWVEITLTGEKDDAQSTSLLEIAAKTLRKAAPNEPKADPFSARQLIAARLPHEYEKVAPLLKKAGAPGELAVLSLLNSSDNRARDVAAKLLPEIATAASINELTRLAQDKDENVANAARAAMKRIAPTKWSPVDDALADLKGGNVFKKRDAMDILAKTPADPAKRQAVATVLEDIILAEHGSVDQDKAGKALAVWAGDKTVIRLLPIVSDERGTPWRRQAAIMALGGTKDKRAAVAILKWIYKEPEAVVAAASLMGSAAEDQILQMQLLRNPDGKVRSNAAQIMSEVGTAKCYQELIRASKDPRDAAAAAVAQAAVEAVKERLKKPVTKPG